MCQCTMSRSVRLRLRATLRRRNDAHSDFGTGAIRAPRGWAEAADGSLRARRDREGGPEHAEQHEKGDRRRK